MYVKLLSYYITLDSGEFQGIFCKLIEVIWTLETLLSGVKGSDLQSACKERSLYLHV